MRIAIAVSSIAFEYRLLVKRRIMDAVSEYYKENEKMRLNGRQIRNACHTALALAEFEAQGGSHEKILHAQAEVKLKVNHIDTVQQAYFDFILYL